MIDDDNYAPQDDEIEENFTELLSKLSASKDSISKASKFALENYGYHRLIFELIIKNLKKSVTKRKIAIFYLIDSICQSANPKIKAKYVHHIANELPRLVNIIVLPTAKELSDPSEMDLEQCKTVVKKVLGLWQERKALTVGEEAFTDCIQEAFLELENPSKNLSPVVEKKAKRSWDTNEVEEILRRIEDHRKEYKRLRWESKLRPENDSQSAQVDEMWDTITMNDVRAAIKDYDWKVAHYFGSGLPSDEPATRKVMPSPFSPTSSLSSPSPSPSTPYSPSKPKKDARLSNPQELNEKKQSIAKDFYSPSSPTSSPENIASKLDKNKQHTKSVPPTPLLIVPPPLNDTPYTFVWNLDETLILFNSLKNQEFSTRYRKSGSLCAKLGRSIERLLYKVADHYLFFKQLEPIDKEANIMMYLAADDGKDIKFYKFATDNFSSDAVDPLKLAYRLRVIKDVYEGAIKFEYLIPRDLYNQIQETYEDINKFTGGWLALSRRLLKAASKNEQITNIIITSEQLIPTLVKMILFGLDEFIPIQNIFSTFAVDRKACLRKIQATHGNKLFVLGQGKDEQACKEENIFYWKLQSQMDLSVIASKIENNDIEGLFLYT